VLINTKLACEDRAAPFLLAPAYSHSFHRARCKTVDGNDDHPLLSQFSPLSTSAQKEIEGINILMLQKWRHVVKTPTS
jgi:hypothetical protein